MPELPEVEVIVRHLKSKIPGLTICSFRVVFPPILRETEIDDLLLIKGKKVNDVRRRGKYILVDVDRGMGLFFHLKMTGQFRFCLPQEPWDKHTRFGLAFMESPLELRFRDVRKFGFVSCANDRNNSVIESLSHLGPEPLEIERDRFVALFQGRKARMKSLLLDQTFIAGIGNIYADEILFRARVNPAVPAACLSEEDLARVWSAMNFILRSAITYRGSSIRDFVDAEGRDGEYQKQHQIYGREGLPCHRCSHKISRLRISGRSSYVCPLCQKLPDV